MKPLFFLFLLTFFTNITLFSQVPYTQAEYETSSIIDVNYGTATNYAGTDMDLLMDIYKPLGDDNCQRPIMVLAHGGAWVTDDKSNSSLEYMSAELAKRGWVVANINYRLGMNNTNDYSTNAFCTGITEPCAFMIDSMEVERANFRAMQDAKAAIRFMKSRNMMDSTDINNVFMAGVCGGGFISLSAGFTNDISKKPASCYAIGDVLAPDPDFADFGCMDANNDLSRPDLGDFEGNLHLGTYDASLQGVGSFFGGVIDLDVFDAVTNPPSVYLFHQASDVIIHYDYGQMFQRISDDCFFGACQKYGPYPHAYGGEGIRKHFNTLGASAPPSSDDILDNMGANDCFSNGHAIDDPELRLQSMVDFFADRIAVSGNTPSSMCTSVSNQNLVQSLDISILENPVRHHLTVNISPEIIGASYALLDVSGRVVCSGVLASEENLINVVGASNGLYFLTVSYQGENQVLKVIKG